MHVWNLWGSVPPTRLRTTGLRNGAWGDHITIQVITDMLSVKITVLSSHGQILSMSPAKCTTEFEYLWA